MYKGIFTEEEVKKLIQIEEDSVNERMVDRNDSRKTSIDLRAQVGRIINPKLEKILPQKIKIGDFPAHFIRNKYPLRIHADMGKDTSLIPYKNILIPLEVKGNSQTQTVLFKQRWYGKTSVFSAIGEEDSDHFFKDRNGKFIHVSDTQKLLTLVENNFGTTLDFNGGEFDCNKNTVGEIKALLKQNRYSQRTNKHIVGSKPFNIEHYNKYLSHQPYEDLTGLEIDEIITWHPWDRDYTYFV